jgi:hypothetical protein
MPEIIEVGALPPGTLPVEWQGGLATSISGSPSEVSRTEITDPITGARIYKRVIMGNPSVTVTLQGGAPPAIGSDVDLGIFGVSGGAYKVISNAPSGSSGELPSYSIVCEDFSI